MKILRLIQSFYPEVRGPINQVFYISKYLQELGIYSRINTTYYGVNRVLPAEEIFEGVPITRYHPRFNLLRYSFCPKIFSHLKDCDILHCHEARSFPVHFGSLMAKKYKKPFVVSTHGSLYAYRHIIADWKLLLPYQIHDLLYLRQSIKAADRIVVSSVQEKEEALEYSVAGEKIVLIPMGIDVNKYPVRQKSNSPQLNLLYISRISWHRNLESVLTALAQIKNVNLKIVGNEVLISGTSKKGYLATLRELAIQLGISERVVFQPACYGQDLADLYCQADAFISTSKYESFGQPILEAAAAGLPIISTPVGVSKEILRDGETGYLVKDDPAEIARKIELLKDNQLRQKISQNIRQLIAEKFNWQKVSLMYKALYEQLL